VAVTDPGQKAGGQSAFPSPLRYPGGKGKLSNYFKLLFQKNGFMGYDYVEPYAGGASVALSLLFEEYASTIHINDVNRSVYAFWSAVLNNHEALCRRLREADVTITEWKRQKQVQLSESADPLDLAFSTIFLNRTNRSGILGGGVIGGKNQDGPWMLDARFSKGDLVRRIEKIARFRSRIVLTQLDAAEFLRKHTCSLPSKSFLYLDPPYFTKGPGLYEHSYQEADHREIATLIGNEKRPWVVSYDSAPFIESLYGGLQRLSYTLPYSAGIRLRGSEVMFFAEGVVPPSLGSPANIPRKVVLDQAKLAVRGWSGTCPV